MHLACQHKERRENWTLKIVLLRQAECGLGYFIIELNGKGWCLLCSDSTAMLKEYDINYKICILYNISNSKKSNNLKN